jgi:hypothetical protein
MTSLEDRFWLTVICAVHQTRWSVARLFSGVPLRICPCFLLLAYRWPDAWEASGCRTQARSCSRPNGAAWRVRGCLPVAANGAQSVTVAHLGFGSRVTRLIGWSRMSLWSTMVVIIQAHGFGGS